MCVKAVLAVADLERKDVNLDLIKVSALVRPQDLLHKPYAAPELPTARDGHDGMWGALSHCAMCTGKSVNVGSVQTKCASILARFVHCM